MHRTTFVRRKLLSRKSYVLQALFILLAMSISLACLVWFVSFDGSPWWLAGADLLLLAACYQALGGFMEAWVPAIAALDALGIVLLAVLILVAPLLSPVALGWTILQALKVTPQA